MAILFYVSAYLQLAYRLTSKCAVSIPRENCLSEETACYLLLVMSLSRILFKRLVLLSLYNRPVTNALGCLEIRSRYLSHGDIISLTYGILRVWIILLLTNQAASAIICRILL